MVTMKQREFDIQSNDNTLFVTEQCNNHCIMCCQPPKNVDDINLLFAENLARITSAPNELPVIGITGGEPTLLGEKLLELIRQSGLNCQIQIYTCLQTVEISRISNILEI